METGTEEKYGKNLRQDSNRLRSDIITRDLPKTKHDVREDVTTPVDPSDNYMYHPVYYYVLPPLPMYLSAPYDSYKKQGPFLYAAQTD
jgi:hypothetical protein